MREGSYVIAVRPVDYRPYTTVQRGETGRVVSSSPDGCVIVALDKNHAGLRAYNNTVLLVPEEADAFVRYYRPLVRRSLKLAAAVVLGLLGASMYGLPGVGVRHAYSERSGPMVTSIERIMEEDGRFYVVRTARGGGNAPPFLIKVVERREVPEDRLPVEIARITCGTFCSGGN